MQTVLRKMGNSTGMILPKALLGELGIATGQPMDVRVEDGRIVAMPVDGGKRAGWAQGAQAVATRSDEEAEMWGAFGNEGDDALTW